MQREPRSKRQASIQFSIERLMIPIAAAICTVFVISQLALHIPFVQSVVARANARVLSPPKDIVPASVVGESGTLMFQLDPAVARPDITVFVNGEAVGTFASPSIPVSVENGDVVSFQTKIPHSSIFIAVQNDDDRILTPVDGDVLELSADRSSVNFPAVKFTN